MIVVPGSYTRCAQLTFPVVVHSGGHLPQAGSKRRSALGPSGASTRLARITGVRRARKWPVRARRARTGRLCASPGPGAAAPLQHGWRALRPVLTRVAQRSIAAKKKNRPRPWRLLGCILHALHPRRSADASVSRSGRVRAALPPLGFLDTTNPQEASKLCPQAADLVGCWGGRCERN